jgi:hypothetical protein
MVGLSFASSQVNALLIQVQAIQDHIFEIIKNADDVYAVENFWRAAEC